MLAGEQPSLTDRSSQFVHRSVEVRVVAGGVAREQPADNVMKIVGPYAVETPAAVFPVFDHRRQIAMVLGVHEHGTRRSAARGIEDLPYDPAVVVLDQRM